MFILLLSSRLFEKRLSKSEIPGKEPLFCEKLKKSGSPSPKTRPKSRFSAKNLKKMALQARKHGQRAAFLRKT